MTYTPSLNPRRGFIIEKFQPVTEYDVALVKRVLEENDEAVIGIGSAEKSHERGYVMTAGERVEITDAVLQEAGVDPNRYMLIPIEDATDTAQWVGDVLQSTPRWHTWYTRNFKNASMLTSYEKKYAFSIERIDEQKPTIDYFEAFGDHQALLPRLIPGPAYELMSSMGILDRINEIYHRKKAVKSTIPQQSRILFLGGLQPFTGDYAIGNGHIGAVKQAFTHRPQVVIAVGSAQHSSTESDPLTVGKRIDVIRYALQKNKIDASKFYTIPIKDIASNACFATKVISMCPAFDAAIAGNDWTKQLFGETSCEIIPIERDFVDKKPLSASYVRKTAMEVLKNCHKKNELVSQRTIAKINRALGTALDPATKKKLQTVGFYETLHFLAYAKE